MGPGFWGGHIAVNGESGSCEEKGLEGQCYRWMTYVCESVHGTASGEGLADAFGVPCQAAGGEATRALGRRGGSGEGSKGRQGSSEAEHCEWCLFGVRLDRDFFFLSLSNEGVDGPVSGIKE